MVEVRLSLGALLLAPLLWRGRAHIGPALWPKLALSAAINSAIPFSLFAWGAERAPAGVGAITNSLAVMFTALVAWIFFGERLDARRLVGLALGVMGVGVLASGRIGGIEVWPAALSGTIAAAFYGVGVNFARQQLAGVPSGAVAAATLVFAAAIEAPLALAFRPTGPIPATIVAQCRPIGSSVHGSCVLPLLSPDTARRGAASLDRDLYRPAFWGLVGLAAARRAAHC